MAIAVERRVEQVNTARNGLISMKARDILGKYPKEKAEALIKALKAKGRWYYDVDFPDDDEDSCPQDFLTCF